jgi:hypothetical protein
MESTRPRPTAAEASAALLDADAARATMADRITMPSWFFASMGVAIAVQIASAAVSLAEGVPWLIVAGVAVFLATAGVQLVRFRRINGVWLSGFASDVVLGTATAASVSYAAAFAAAIWAAYGNRWWLVALWSAIGGGAYALSGRRWLHRYHADPAAHARGESLVWLFLLIAAAIVGLAVLVLNA